MKKVFFLFLIISTLSNNAFAKKERERKITKPTERTETNFTKNEEIPSKQVLANGFADVIEGLLPTVVNISAIPEEVNVAGLSTIDQILNERKKKDTSIGSGLVVAKDGLIITNHHVIEDSEKITVTLDNGAKYTARLIGVDKKTDLALLKINPDKELKFAKFGDSSKVRVGEWAIVVGNPYGLGQSVSVGIVSAKGRNLNNGNLDEFIQTDAAINNGNSGGPMFNSKGEVIGISTAIFSPLGGNIGIGFATPSANVTQVIKQLRDQGEVARGWLGVSVQDVNDEIAEAMKIEKGKGIFVVDVFADEPAAKAGIMPADVILKFNDQEISDIKLLPKFVANFPIGRSAKLTVLRRGKIRIFNVIVTKMRDDVDNKKPESRVIPDKKQALRPSANLLGIGLVELNERVRKSQNITPDVNGILVVDVNLKSEAAEKNLAIGDVILSANQVALNSISDLKSVIDDAKKTSAKLFLFVKRGDSNYPVVLGAR